MSRISAAGASPSLVEAQPESEPEAAQASSPSSGRLAQRQSQVSPYSLEDAVGQARVSLSRALLDPVVSDKDVDRVHTALEKLPPTQYGKALQQLDDAGLLERYAKEMSTDARDRFLRQAVAKGYVKEIGGIPTEPRRDPTGKPYSPPELPKFIGLKADPLGPVYDLAARYNDDVVSKYERDYADYLDRYGDAVQRALEPATLRQLGEPTLPHTFPERRLYIAPRSTWGQREFHTRYNELMGRVPHGFVVHAGAEATVNIGGPVHLKAESSVTRLPGNVIQTNADHALELNVEKDPVFFGLDSNRDLHVGIDTHGFEAKATWAKNGNLELEFARPVMMFGPATINVGAKVVADSEHNTLLGGVTVEADARFATVQTEVMAGFRGLQSDAARRAVQDDPDGIFDPPELRQGLRWEELSPQRQRALSIRHSELSWNAALDAAARRQR